MSPHYATAMQAALLRFAIAVAVLGAGCATTDGEAPSRWRTWTGADATRGTAESLTTLAVGSLPVTGGAEWMARWAVVPATLPWTDETLRLVVKYQHNPLRAARALTLVHVALHDAAVLADRAQVPPGARAIAMHRAAGMVLGHLYAGELPGRLEALGIAGAVAVAQARAVAGETFSRAHAAGTAAGEATIERALRDASGRVWPHRLRPADAPGGWRAAPPLNLYDPAEAFAGEWRPWVLASGSELSPPPPPAFDGEAYWREAREVLEVSRALTPEQKRIADEWHLDAGSVTPAGVWNRKARELALAARLDDAQSARLFAALNVAMMDAFIACWNAKMKWWTQRPVNAVRDRYAPSWLPYLVTPPFPAYPSGHATVSGAAAQVLGAFFPARAAEFAAMAAEAAESRLYGGIHFRSDNEEGLRLGTRIGQRAVQALEAQRAPASTR